MTTEALLEDLRKMYEDQLEADVTIQIGDRSLKTHRSILRARSPVFSKMLEYDMLEKKTGCIPIEDFDPEIFEKFLRFLYTGELPTDFEALVELNRAADKYAVSSLLSSSLVTMCSAMNVENVSTVLLLAKRQADLATKGKAIIYIRSYLHSVVCQQSWARLVVEEPELANEATDAWGSTRSHGSFVVPKSLPSSNVKSVKERTDVSTSSIKNQADLSGMKQPPSVTSFAMPATPRPFEFGFAATSFNCSKEMPSE